MGMGILKALGQSGGPKTGWKGRAVTLVMSDGRWALRSRCVLDTQGRCRPAGTLPFPAWPFFFNQFIFLTVPEDKSKVKCQ